MAKFVNFYKVTWISTTFHKRNNTIYFYGTLYVSFYIHFFKSCELSNKNYMCNIYSQTKA